MVSTVKVHFFYQSIDKGIRWHNHSVSKRCGQERRSTSKCWVFQTLNFLHLISPENALEAKCITCGENRTYVRKNLSITINRWFKLSIPLNGGLWWFMALFYHVKHPHFLRFPYDFQPWECRNNCPMVRERLGAENWATFFEFPNQEG